MASRPARRDGRNARRDRNAEAVLDAANALFVEGNLTPSVEAVAERSGVSLRSVYRYFEDTDALMRAAIARRVEVLGDLFELPDLGAGPLAARIDRYVDHRMTLHDRLAPAVRAALLRAPTAPPIAEQIARRRRELFRQTARHFAPELAAMPADRSAAAAACLDALFQIEAMDYLRIVRRMSRARTKQVLTGGVTALLRDAPG